MSSPSVSGIFIKLDWLNSPLTYIGVDKLGETWTSPAQALQSVASTKRKKKRGRSQRAKGMSVASVTQAITHKALAPFTLDIHWVQQVGGGNVGAAS